MTVRKKTDLQVGEREGLVRRLLRHSLGVSLSFVVFFLSFLCYSISTKGQQMTDKGWRSKGDKGFRRSPRQTGKTCGRPFSAPRQARQTTAKTKKIADPKEINDREVRILTESELQMLASMGAATSIPGFDDSEEAQGGNSLDDESNHDKTDQDRLPHDRSEETAQVTAMSDTTESTPYPYPYPTG